MSPAVPITHRLRRAQGNTLHTLHLLHKIGRAEVYLRLLSGRPRDYAVLLGSLTAHGPTPALAITALRAVLRERAAIDAQPLNWQRGLDAGCTPDALTTFCRINQLDPAQSITLGELRRTVTAHRAANQPYARQLGTFGIHLSPPKK